MTYQELLELKNTRAQKLKEGADLLKKKDFTAHKALKGEITKMNAEIDAAEVQLAEEGRFDDKDEKLKGIHLDHKKQQEELAKGKAVDVIRSTNEYANAFSKALRSGVTVKRARGVEEFAPLMKALQETGGSPEGADGGFLVPQDFDNMIHQLEKEYLDLSQLFTVETVTTLSGWRAVEQGTRKALPKIAEMGTVGKDDQPKFAKVSYTVDKYGDRLPVSSELLEDNTAGLLQYLANWFGPKYILTKNTLLLGLLTALETEVALTAGSEAKELRQAIITKLNSAHSKSAILLTNQSGYAEMDGWEDVKTIRKYSQVPIIMRTARGEESDELQGFNLGVDEYISKPFSPKILVARVEAILRRSNGGSQDVIDVGGIHIDKTAHQVSVDGKPVDLSYKEFELMTYFAENQGIALSREKILNNVWNYDYFGDARTIDTHVKKLRSKLGEKGEYIKTIWGMGYKFEVSE